MKECLDHGTFRPVAPIGRATVSKTVCCWFDPNQACIKIHQSLDQQLNTSLHDGGLGEPTQDLVVVVVVVVKVVKVVKVVVVVVAVV